MKLSKIIKNRKAMTPLMIGIIVAASVIAVLFIVMAAVIPLFPNDVYMQVRDNSVKGNATGDMQLQFKIMCDFEDGQLYKAELYFGDVLYGDAEEFYWNGTVSDGKIAEREELLFSVKGFAYTAEVPALERNDTLGYVVLQDGKAYTLRIHYRNTDQSVDAYTSFDFTYAEFED